MAFSRILTVQPNVPVWEYPYGVRLNRQQTTAVFSDRARPWSSNLRGPRYTGLVDETAALFDHNAILFGITDETLIPADGDWRFEFVRDGDVLASGTFTMTSARQGPGGNYPWRYGETSASAISIDRSTSGDLDLTQSLLRGFPVPDTDQSFDLWCEVQSADSGVSIFAVDDTEPDRQVRVRAAYDARVDGGYWATLDGVRYSIRSITEIVPYRLMELVLRGA